MRFRKQRRPRFAASRRAAPEGPRPPAGALRPPPRHDEPLRRDAPAPLVPRAVVRPVRARREPLRARAAPATPPQRWPRDLPASPAAARGGPASGRRGPWRRPKAADPPRIAPPPAPPPRPRRRSALRSWPARGPTIGARPVLLARWRTRSPTVVPCARQRLPDRHLPGVRRQRWPPPRRRTP